MNKFCFLPHVLSCAVFIAGCANNSQPSKPFPTTGKINGKVTSRTTDLPIPGATVSTQPATSVALTDSFGNYFLTDIVPGNYVINVTAKGFIVGTQNVGVNPNQTSTANLELVFQVPTAGLIAYYPFDGNADDASGKTNHGVIHGATPTLDRFDRHGQAYFFGGSAYIDLGSRTVLNPTTGVTFAAWIKDAGGSGVKNIISRWNDQIGVNQRVYSFGLRAANVGYFIISSDGTALSAVAIEEADSIARQTWHFYAATWEASAMRLYRNGVEVAAGVQPLMHFSTTTRTGIGATLGQTGAAIAGTLFNGTIDDVRIYDRALSLDEIKMLYNEQ